MSHEPTNGGSLGGDDPSTSRFTPILDFLFCHQLDRDVEDVKFKKVIQHFVKTQPSGRAIVEAIVKDAAYAGLCKLAMATPTVQKRAGCSSAVTLDPSQNPFKKYKLHANNFFRKEVEAAVESAQTH